MTTNPKTETAAKKNVQKLQRAIVDGLEDVKAQDIRVFNTEHLSPLFERVIIASGTSNRQTKALASSVRDAVREAGFDKPRTEGEDNGEWIIVDCGAAVAHIMQPSIRQYYHLEEIWGDTPVSLKSAASKSGSARKARVASEPEDEAAPAKAPAKKAAARKSAVSKADADDAQAAPVKKPAARKSAAKSADTTSAKSGTRTAAKAPAKKAAAPQRVREEVEPINSPARVAARLAADEAAARKKRERRAGKAETPTPAPVRKAPAKKAAAKTSAAPASRSKVLVVGAPAKKPAGKTAARKSPARKSAR